MSKRKQILIASLWLFYFLVMLAVYVSNDVSAGDYNYYYRGAVRLLEGQPLFVDLAPNDYVGPPLVVILVLPIVALTSYETSIFVWLTVSFIMLIASLMLLSGEIRTPRRRFIFWISSLFFVPIFHSLWFGQITVFMLLLTAAAWVAYRRGYPVLAGICLAVVVWTKFYPGLLLVYFLWKREWRVIFSAGVATVAVIVFQMLFSGFDQFLRYFTDVLPLLVAEGQPFLNHSNNSVLGFAQRLFSPSAQVILVADSPLLLSLTRFSLSALLLGVWVYAISRPHITMDKTPLAKFDLEYGMTLTIALLLGSTLGTHGMLSMLIVLVILLDMPTPPFMMRQRRRFQLWALAAISLINLHLFLILGALRPPSENVLPALALSTPFFGMMILWFMLAVRLLNWRQTDTVSSSTTPNV